MAEYNGYSLAPTMITEMLNGTAVTGNGYPNPAQLAFLSYLAAEDAERQQKYRDFRDYYDGIHETLLTDRQAAYLQVKTGQEFNANYCDIVVDALAERLRVAGFDAGKDQGGDDGILWRWWQQNRMDGQQGDLHTAAIRDGDTFLITEWDNELGRPSFSHELAYDGTQGVKVHYRKDKRRAIAYASKRWRVESEGATVGQTARINIYTADAVYRYTQGPKDVNWQPYVEDGGQWPQPWLDKKGQPLGVPVIHFANKRKGYDFGVSELENVIPLQNALNKSIIDLLAAADTTAFRIFTMLGNSPHDEDGNLLTIAPGSWIWMNETPAEGHIGHIPGEDMRQLIEVVDSFITRIAQVSRTPLAYFQATRQIAAADTQRADESPLISKAEDRSVHLGNSWEDAMLMARRLHNTFGSGPELDETAAISTTWASFDRVDKLAVERARSEIVLNLTNAGASLVGAVKVAGYSDEEQELLIRGDVIDGIVQ